MRGQLAALAGATFVFVTSELQPVALLPQMAHGLGVREGTVGILLTVYAAVAGASAIPLTAATARMSRRRLVIGCVALLVVSQAGAALAPTYGVLLGARLVAALAHGVFWSVIARVAASLLDPERSGQATAVVFAGNSLALVLGTPLVTALGVALGWREAIALLGGAAAVVVLALLALVPDIPAQPTRQRTVRAAAANPGVLAVCAVTLVIVIGQFAAFTYFVPIVRLHTGLTGGAVSAIFLAYGAAGVAGLALVGAGADRALRAAMLSCGLLMTAAMALLSALGGGATPETVLAVVVWGAAFTAVPVCLQAAILRVAPDVPDTASSLYVVAFQIGIGSGSLLGGLLVNGHALGALTPVALGTSALATAVAAAASRAFPRRRTRALSAVRAS